MTVIIEILLFAILVLLAVALYLAKVYFDALADLFSDRLTEIEGQILIANGYSGKVVTEIADFRRDFSLTFDSDLRAKVNAVMEIGKKPIEYMEKFNPQTGEMELVEIDKGWY